MFVYPKTNPPTTSQNICFSGSSARKGRRALQLDVDRSRA